jgi:hypothetical protein
MLLLPIELDESQNMKFRENPECIPILDVYPGYYKKKGLPATTTTTTKATTTRAPAAEAATAAAAFR